MMVTKWCRAPGLLVLILAGIALAKDEKSAPKQSSERAEPYLEVGGHTGQIDEMVFSKDDSRLYTVGSPGDVHEFDTNTGERLRSWRFPQPVHRLSLSGNGERLTVAGGSRPVAGKKGKSELPIWTIFLESGNALVRRTLPTKQSVQRMAWAPKGLRLAISHGSVTEVLSLKETGQDLVLESDNVNSLDFAPGGRWLVTTRKTRQKPRVAARLYHLTPKGDRKGIPLPQAGWENPIAAFSPDATHVACVSGDGKISIQVWQVSDKVGAPEWTVTQETLMEKFGKKLGLGTWHPIGLHFLSDKELLTCWRRTNYLYLVRLDIQKKAIRSIDSSAIRVQSEHSGRMAVSHDGRWLAVTAQAPYVVAMYDLKEMIVVTNPFGRKKSEIEFRLGSPLPRPQLVAWAPKGHGLAWGFLHTKGLTRGLDLDTLQPLPEDRQKNAVTGSVVPDKWKLETSGGKTTLVRPREKIPLDFEGVDTSRLFVYTAGKGQGRRMLVVHDRGRRLSVVDPSTGKEIKPIGHRFDAIRDFAVSPDRRYLAVATGELPIRIYALDDPREPILSILPKRSDWVAWTKEGYYTGTADGERSFGWTVGSDPNRQAMYYPAAAFRKRFRKPEVIQSLLATGSLQKSLQKYDVKASTLDECLPPRVDVDVIQDQTDKSKVTIQVKARSLSPNQPIQTLRLMVDGRPLPNDEGVHKVGKGGSSTAVTWKLDDLPPGPREIKVLARCPDIYGFSPGQEVMIPGAVKRKPVMHVVSVGLNYKGKGDLELGCPVNDAQAVAKAFDEKCCKGPRGLFDRCNAQVIVKDATRKAILDALAKVRKQVRPQDVVVFFFAGHGVSHGPDFYLLSEGYDLDKLGTTAVSGEALREAFENFPCHVLMLLDACHSGGAGPALRRMKPATDDASRNLADDSCGVVLLSAAMVHERAEEPRNGTHGFFTQAILDTLGRDVSKGVAFNKRDGRQYVQHLWLDVQEEVQDKTSDRQHPFLCMPWTVEPFAVRRVR